MLPGFAADERQQEQWVASSGGGGDMERERKREREKGKGERGRDCRLERGVNGGR